MYLNKNKISRSDFLKTSGVAIGGVVALSHYACSGDINSLKELIIQGKTNFNLVLPIKANDKEKEAAQKMQFYLSKVWKSLEVLNEEEYSGENGIFLGKTVFAKNAGVDSFLLEEDAYFFKRLDYNLIIAGGAENGLLNGVYSLLEFFGFRKYSADDPLLLPEKNTFSFPRDELKTPMIKYRTTNYYDARDADYKSWHKLSCSDSWGMFVHTFELLISPEKYGKTHPEYFSLIDGERNPVTQLCLSNEEVFQTLVAELKERIEKNPNAKYWSVSQNDNDKYCKCLQCSALNQKYGNLPSGSMVWFVNKVAREFPDKIISTLAYWYTRAAPSNIVAEPNVNIMLCNIESTREKPVFDTDPAFTSDLQDWGKISQDILIWDYNIQFANPVSPFPNLHTIGPNIKFYIQNNVRALFMQATGNKGEFGHLRAYLITKLMWNPNADPNLIINDFLHGYYGEAATLILNYIDRMREALLNDNFRLNIFGDPRDAINNYLAPDKMIEYNRLFDEAEKLVIDNKEKLTRVREARLPLLIAEVQIAGQIPVGQKGSFYTTNDNGNVLPKSEMKNKVEKFVASAKKAGIQRIGERAITIDDYAYNFERIFSKMEQMDKAISFKKKVIPISVPTFGKENITRLTDGIFGAFESWRFPDKDANWVAYKGKHMDFILDLGTVMPINSVEMDFLNVQAQANWHQLILPKFVTYAISQDGVNYSDSIQINNPHNPNPAENPEIVKLPFLAFKTNYKNTKARYLKVHAESELKMPNWHINAGKPAILYADEIVVC
tara:strand:- start:470 stop:2806 length:2337 start_codon:yes stop_codon:yes gene_type:complete